MFGNAANVYCTSHCYLRVSRMRAGALPCQFTQTEHAGKLMVDHCTSFTARFFRAINKTRIFLRHFHVFCYHLFNLHFQSRQEVLTASIKPLHSIEHAGQQSCYCNDRRNQCLWLHRASRKLKPTTNSWREADYSDPSDLTPGRKFFIMSFQQGRRRIWQRQD